MDSILDFLKSICFILALFAGTTLFFGFLIGVSIGDTLPTQQEINACFDNLVPSENRDSAVYIQAMMDLCEKQLTITGVRKGIFYSAILNLFIFAAILLYTFKNIFSNESSSDKNIYKNEVLTPTGIYVEGYYNHQCKYEEQLNLWILNEFNTKYGNELTNELPSKSIFDKFSPEIKKLCKDFCVETYETENQFYRAHILLNHLTKIKDAQNISKTEIGKIITKLKTFDPSKKGFLQMKEIAETLDILLHQLDNLYMNKDDPTYQNRYNFLIDFKNKLA